MAVGRPWPRILAGSTTLLTLYRAVGPAGSLTCHSVWHFLFFSEKTSRLVKPRSAAAPTIALSSWAPRLRYSAFGSSVTISSRKVSISDDGFGLVVTTVRGGTLPEKCAANSSNESSAATSASSGCTTVSSGSRVLSSVRCAFRGAASSPSSSASFCRFFRSFFCSFSPCFANLANVATRFCLLRMPLARAPAPALPRAIGARGA